MKWIKTKLRNLEVRYFNFKIFKLNRLIIIVILNWRFIIWNLFETDRLNQRSSDDEHGKAQRRASAASLLDQNLIDFDDEDEIRPVPAVDAAQHIDATSEGAVEELVEPGTFNPLVVCREVEASEEENKYLATAIVLPCGATQKDVKLSIIQDGHVLDFEYVWPQVLTDVKLLLKFKWEAAENKIHIYHPIVSAFRNFFKNFRMSKAQQIISHSYVKLPCPVETNFPKPIILDWSQPQYSSNRILYVKLMCVADDYDEEDGEFSVVKS